MFPFTIVFRRLKWAIEAINIHDIQTISFEHVKCICVIVLKTLSDLSVYLSVCCLSVCRDGEREAGCKWVSDKIRWYLGLTGTVQYHTNDIVTSEI